MEAAPGLHTQQDHGLPMGETPGLHTQQAPGLSLKEFTNSDDEAESPPHRHRDVDLPPSDSAGGASTIPSDFGHSTGAQFHQTVLAASQEQGGTPDIREAQALAAADGQAP